VKILYISPENTVGTLTLWKKIHEENGHECRTVTFFKSPKNFDEDICLNLPFNFTKSRLAKIRHWVYQQYRGEEGYFKAKDGIPPKWQPEGRFDSIFFTFKDWLWKPIVEKSINQYDLYNSDVVHFESGMDFLKNEFFVKALSEKGVKIIAHYHGEDMRARGVMPHIDRLSNLNLTNEVDLLEKHPNIHYLFLPFDTSKFNPKTKINKKVRVVHAPTNRFYKGSDTIINVCDAYHKNGEIEFDLVENVSHEEALKRKYQADIFIDQLGDKGGWGYGMNSVEALAMGICTITEMNNTYHNFIPDHPFVHATKESFQSVLGELIQNKSYLQEKGIESRQWVVKHHDIKNVAKKLYEYYRSIGLDV